MQLPEQQPTRPGQPDPVMDQALLIAAAVNEALGEKPLAYRDDTPLPTIGTTPPVAQPGRPPMSQKATDASALMLAGGATTVMVGGAASLVMLASGYADPVVCAVVLGAPAVVVLAISRLVGRAKAAIEAAPSPIHQHYNGPVTITHDQRSITTDTRGLWARTTNHSKES
ncbi:hypothetical protein OG244_28420 [Streptomyces brevispora]|uniref:hypothetical protein n=1 Tax=Streptomyces brevispora TaxID=887462 RepID=UPI002E317E21|nr:hypothetical protein [Streptomyces brevispora]